MKNIRTNIQTLNKQAPAPFSNDIIQNYNTYLRRNDIWLKEKGEDYLGPIPLDQVIGIDQMYGDDSTWGQCLEGRWLKRLKSRLIQLEDNPQYYLSECEMKKLSFIKVGDKYFISEGKHRTIIARFLSYFNPEVFNGRSPFEFAQVTEYFIDTEYNSLKGRFNAIAESYPSLQFKLQHTTSEDDLHFLLIKEKKNFGRSKVFSRTEAYQVLNSLESPSVKEKWNSGPANIYSFIPYQTCFKALFGKL
ncbi:hypothetical protein L2719_10265 [Shewanella schlegeliana]|uniref:Uncharacterized protein n=1 Tax=Shewanella schlegeliana TaxID=190308 RepID=A0ABS1T1R4_9GAMM|nr:hypothetical protein [Shewanella schlegeliana]MBL4914737.1 hypothetical protein [Shewanella schlegeliana]MCL1109931.1 hypothetical protein [Shewanella schlegeliana]GIU25596.1 hypothetical protein TUM4433_10550 [Shewanella schlegeliana]